MRLAFWHTELSRKGPGLLLADFAKGQDQAQAVVNVLSDTRADILVLAGVDYDHGLATLSALRDAVRGADGPDYPHIFAPRPNTGLDTGFDMDGDGERGGAADAQGYGRFAGQGGLAVLSRWPLTLSADHTDLLWRDVPDSLLIDHAGMEGAAALGADVQRLSSVAHAELTVAIAPDKSLTVMIFHAGPPVFDGPEDRNGRRNHDEVLFWKHRLDGVLGPPPDPPFVLVGAANLAPDGGDGRSAAIRALLDDPRLHDPPPLTGQTTVDWPDPGPGRLRVDYILPSAGLPIRDAGLHTTDAEVSRHSLIWVDLDVTPPP